MRVLLDTNILVRAFMESEGPASSVLQICLQPEHRLILSEEILFEVARVLRSSRMVAMHQKSEEAIYNFIWRLRIAAAILPPRPLAQTPIRDPNDIPILQTALSGQADVLCTCDRDFFAPPASGFLKKREIDVLTDVELMRRLRA